VLCLLLLSIISYSQTSTKTLPYSAINLNRYIWSFSKNSSKPGEKALIDFDVIDNWRQLGGYLSVNNDGSYFAYTINKMVYNDLKTGVFKLDSLVIQSTKNGERAVFAGLQPGSFTSDGKQYVFNDKGSLCFLQLGTINMLKIADVASYKILQGKWLAYELKDKEGLNLRNLASGEEKQFAAISDYSFSSKGEWLIGKSKNKELTLYNLTTGKERRFLSVEEYLLAENGKHILIKTQDKYNAVLQYINLPAGDVKTIWDEEKTSIVTYCMDADGKQAAFYVADSLDAADMGVWYYTAGMNKTVLKISGLAEEIAAGLTIGEMSFTDNGNYLNVSLHPMPGTISKPNNDIAGVEVWNHKDLELQSNQAKLLNQQKDYRGVVNVRNGKLVFLESNDKKLWQLQGDFAILKKDYQDLVGDRFWEKTSNANNDSTWIVNLKDGSCHLLPTISEDLWFSPDGKYLVYFDNRKGCHYFSYDLNTREVKDITVNVPENELGIGDRQDQGDSLPKVGCLAAWVKEGFSVLVYDNYDIWKLDMTGKQPAVNITNGFGQSNNIIFNLFGTARRDGKCPIIPSNEYLILRAYNIQNKLTGFYSKVGLKAQDPKLVYMGEYFMQQISGIHNGNLSNIGMAPMKAQKANSWIVQRQSTNDAPNYYETTDFKNYKRLTNFQPQKSYQWLKEELHSFKFLDGTIGEGILYKPENFDPKTKYPVLIVFYEEFSNNFYQFHVPLPIGSYAAITPGVSPLWLLNNGFLVFTPDIKVTPLKYGPSAYNVIEGATRYLNQLPYVDAGKLGGAAHSWSSRLACYIFPHSTSFAATTISGCGVYNPISTSLSLGRFETVEGENGNLWENQDAWIDGTAILQANKATCAFLLLENTDGGANQLDQVFQMFTVLRRLDKNVWWLKYDKGEHNVNNPIEAKDYTIRYTQFFDHYLKNAPAPRWMTQGVPYKLKGVESRYELDPQGKCSSANAQPCPICEAWNDQYKKTPAMFIKEIKDWSLASDIAAALERKQKERRKELDKQGELQTKEVLNMLAK
jgi:dipeptidyl aminopeptidase/acylaminoacyl peptidase